MQQEENYLAQTISQADIDARYDEGVKRLLANKSILAVIMKECVPEYRDCTTKDIAEKYIEGEPQIGAVGVNIDETNRVNPAIHGINTEDATLTEGTIRYDVRFYASTERGRLDWSDSERGGAEPLQCGVSVAETCYLLLQQNDFGAVRHRIYQR